eukprot:CAMPEP_0194274478 /NCGR_PEP_ID=MMETSP0169-20130528/7555_1 /TAXON_ID=218684 /ORGANISM="Corethron pennatum, Strain L29A3" /LENGTH=228 /DNA_ID=CAMNT_0039017683 /DNA_START=12 /DNA_END=698 /DNA_ORIENTATION=-
MTMNAIRHVARPLSKSLSSGPTALSKSLSLWRIRLENVASRPLSVHIRSGSPGSRNDGAPPAPQFRCLSDVTLADGSAGSLPAAASSALSEPVDVSLLTMEELEILAEEHAEHPLIWSPPFGKRPKMSMIGKVVSDKMDKTVAVSVDRFHLNKKYGKKIRYTRKFLTHNVPEDAPPGSPVAGGGIRGKEPDEPAKLGDTVLIAPGRKLSKRKAHYIYRILRRAPQLWD